MWLTKLSFENKMMWINLLFISPEQSLINGRSFLTAAISNVIELDKIKCLKFHQCKERMLVSGLIYRSAANPRSLSNWQAVCPHASHRLPVYSVNQLINSKSSTTTLLRFIYIRIFFPPEETSSIILGTDSYDNFSYLATYHRRCLHTIPAKVSSVTHQN